MEAPQAPNEERTAHHVRRLHDSIRDLQNGTSTLGVVTKTERPPRPHSATITSDTVASEDPYSRIAANNERGVVQNIEKMQDIGAVVLGLQSVGALISDALCRYGVKRLVVGDTTEIGVGDLDCMTYYIQDIGHRRDDRIASASRRLNPEMDVFPLGLSLSDTKSVIDSLRSMLTECADDTDSSDDDNGGGGGGSGDDDSETEHSDSDSGKEERGNSSRRLLRGQSRHDASSSSSEDWDELCFNVVFLCGSFPQLAMALNELCCEFGIQLVYVTMGKNGMSGDILTVVPGRSACLQCLEKRKVLKISPPTGNGDGPEKPLHCAGLPTTECVLAGIAVQHVFSNVVGAGPTCSRVEYDGHLEELDRSGFIAPVHQCPSQFCRDQQQEQAE